MALIVESLGMACPLKNLNLARNTNIGLFDFTSVSGQIFLSLKKMDLSDCGIDDKFSEKLAKALSSTTDLVLKINANPDLGVKGTSGLMSLSLKEFHASKCNIGESGLQQIFNHSSNMDNLRVLDLSHNNLSPAGIHYVAAQLEQSVCCLSQLEELNLAGNQLDENSCQAFAAALGNLNVQDKIKLSHLDMTDTSCGINGAIDLIRLVQLRSLILFNNKLGSDGLLTLATVLQGGHPTLETLDAGGNEATEAGVVALLQAFTIKNESFENALRLLVVGGNESGPMVETVVKEIEQVHPEIDIARDKPRKQHQLPDEIDHKMQVTPGAFQ